MTMKPENRLMGYEVDEAVIYIGYGELMRKLQLIELSLWQIQTLRAKPMTQAKHAFDKVEKLDGTTFGSLVRGMRTQDHWPAEMVNDLQQAVELRNFLAHHFLREFFLVEPSGENYARGAEQLSDWCSQIEALATRLDAHVEAMSDVVWDDLDDDLKAAIEAMRPESWPLFSPHDSRHED